jgi:hypothetical protein
VNPVKTAGQFVLENVTAAGKVGGVEAGTGIWAGIKALGRLIGIGREKPAAPTTGINQVISGATASSNP